MTKAMMKAFKSHCGAMAKTCEAKAASCKELSNCQKAAVDAGLAKATTRDHYMDLHDCYKAESESWSKMHDACGKADSADDLQKITSAVVASVMEVVNERIGKLVQPSLVKGAFLTADPMPVLVGRQGGPSIPVQPTQSRPQFADLFRE